MCIIRLVAVPQLPHDYSKELLSFRTNFCYGGGFRLKRNIFIEEKSIDVKLKLGYPLIVCPDFWSCFIFPI